MMKVQLISGYERALRENIKERFNRLSTNANEVLKRFVSLGEIELFRGEVKDMLGILLKQPEKGGIMLELQRLKFVDSKISSPDTNRGSQEIYLIEEAYRPILQELLFSE